MYTQKNLGEDAMHMYYMGIYYEYIYIYTYLRGIKYKTIRGWTKGGPARNKGWTHLSLSLSLSLYIYIYIYICLYLSLYKCIYLHIYIYIYIYRMTGYGKDGADWKAG